MFVMAAATPTTTQHPFSCLLKKKKKKGQITTTFFRTRKHVINFYCLKTFIFVSIVFLVYVNIHCTNKLQNNLSSFNKVDNVHDDDGILSSSFLFCGVGVSVSDGDDEGRNSSNNNNKTESIAKNKRLNSIPIEKKKEDFLLKNNDNKDENSDNSILYNNNNNNHNAMNTFEEQLQQQQKQEWFLHELQKQQSSSNDDMLFQLSLKHQKKFFQRKHWLNYYYQQGSVASSSEYNYYYSYLQNQNKLFFSETKNWGAIQLNDTYAYIHIWKCGGTTIELQSAKEQIPVRELLNSKRQQQQRRQQQQHPLPFFITFVRDPIDHFLSGWAECGYRSVMRQQQQRRSNSNNNNAFDNMVRKWMDRLSSLDKEEEEEDTTKGGRNNASSSSSNNKRKSFGPQKKNVPKYINQMILEWLNYTQQQSTSTTLMTRRQKKQGCERHSFPQINFLLQSQQRQRHANITSTTHDVNKDNSDDGVVQIMDQLVLIGDLKELTNIWKHIFKYPYYDDTTLKQMKRQQQRQQQQASSNKTNFGSNHALYTTSTLTRNSTNVYIKNTFFPTNRLDLLDNTTIQKICEYVELDYFLLDYEPPPQCQHIFSKFE